MAESVHPTKARPPARSARFLLLSIGLFTLCAIGVGIWSLLGLGSPRAQPLPPPPPGKTGTVIPELVRIEPGTDIGTKLPAGWTHKMVCTGMSIDSGDLHLLPEPARATASRMRTAMLVEVRKTPEDSGIYQIHRVGVGLTMQHQGVNMVVTPNTVDELGIPMSIVDRFVLGRSEEAVTRGRLAARTSTFALYDASVEFTEGTNNDHKAMFLRHALILDPDTGSLRELVWRISMKPEERTPAVEVIQVACPLDFQCGIHVKAKTIAGKIPVGWHFAMTKLPTGTPIAVSKTSAVSLVGDPATLEESEQLESLLREILDSQPRDQPSLVAPDTAAAMQRTGPGAKPGAQSSPSTPSL